MFKHIKFIPMFVLMLATLAPVSASAKVPFHADEQRGSDITATTPATARTTSFGRYRRASTVTRVERLEKCQHSHRYSWQHWM